MLCLDSVSKSQLQDKESEAVVSKRTIKSTILTGSSTAKYFSDELFFTKHGKITAMKFYFKDDVKSFNGYVET